MESAEVSTTTDHKLFALFTLDGNHETDGIIAVHLEKSKSYLICWLSLA